MKKTVSRDLVFTGKEVFDAILFMLRQIDHPTPSEGAEVSFRLSESGASLAWTETTEQ